MSRCFDKHVIVVSTIGIIIKSRLYYTVLEKFMQYSLVDLLVLILTELCSIGCWFSGLM